VLGAFIFVRPPSGVNEDHVNVADSGPRRLIQDIAARPILRLPFATGCPPGLVRSAILPIEIASSSRAK